MHFISEVNETLIVLFSFIRDSTVYDKYDVYAVLPMLLNAIPAVFVLMYVLHSQIFSHLREVVL